MSQQGMVPHEAEGPDAQVDEVAMSGIATELASVIADLPGMR